MGQDVSQLLSKRTASTFLYTIFLVPFVVIDVTIWSKSRFVSLKCLYNISYIFLPVFMAFSL